MMIEVSNLTKKFNGVNAVDNISFFVEEGETLVLLGTSGCGKTTTLKMINRLIEPTSGTILIQDKDIKEQKPEELRRGIGYVIQNVGLFPHYTVEQNIAIVPNLLHWDRDRTARRVRELLEMLGLPPEDFLRRYPEELSGGQKQRIGVARALAADPPVVLLDEPLGALDPITRGQIQKEFKTLEAILRKTMIFVTHDISEAIELGDRICLMDRGAILQIDTPGKLIFSPTNEYVRGFFQANRFQIELKVLTLKDILPDIQGIEIDGEPVTEFHEDTRLLEVLEAVERASPLETIIRITDTGNKIIAHVRFYDILSAFYRTRARLSQ